MDTSKIENPDDTPKTGFHVDGLNVNEVLEVSEQLSDLDHESKSMLFLLCLSTFNELQNCFVNNYKKLLQCKKNSKKRISDEELNLYNILKESQDNFLNKPLEEDESEPAPTPTPHEETSLLRAFWRRYRIELFLKIMLVIFLLKLPYFCYVLTTVVYILYCLGFFGLVVRLSLSLRNSRNAQSLSRVFVNIMETLEPLLLIPSLQGPNAQRNDGQTTNLSGTRPGFGSRRRRAAARPAAQSVPVQPVSEPSTSFVRPTQVPEGQEPQSATVFGPQPRSQSSQPAGSQEPQQTTETSTREKPTYIEKFIYQVFFSFILSLLPWWEPNPVYLEE